MTALYVIYDAIIKDPLDDLSRYAYADWLDENLVHVCDHNLVCIRAMMKHSTDRIDVTSPNSRDINESVSFFVHKDSEVFDLRRSFKLSLSYLEAKNLLGRWVRRVTVRKGLVDGVKCAMGWWIENGPLTVIRYPVTQVSFTDVSPRLALQHTPLPQEVSSRDFHHPLPPPTGLFYYTSSTTLTFDNSVPTYLYKFMGHYPIDFESHPDAAEFLHHGFPSEILAEARLSRAAVNWARSCNGLPPLETPWTHYTI